MNRKAARGKRALHGHEVPMHRTECGGVVGTSIANCAKVSNIDTQFPLYVGSLGATRLFRQRRLGIEKCWNCR
jgi:hypothetical protein